MEELVNPPEAQGAENPIDGNISKVQTSFPQQLNETVPTGELSSNRGRPSYAVMVDPNEVKMPLEEHFPEYIEFAKEKDVIIKQKLVYEWRPIKCTQCRMFGHTREECRKIASQRQEWRVKASQVTSQNQHQQVEVHEQNGEEDFQPVTRHTARHQVISNQGQGSSTPAIEKLTANTFSVLWEEEDVQTKGGEGDYTPNG
ncbi:hypothetical protein Cgig2_027794 [Carnegiea gigantea]|uniref:Uncharacterized protein n=1 Tax=Carnegiea gigantea TaxID=171969 RepID=A0A9Q1GK06_9CARY|nr:hypothetical protein Cgig2_027794 [Carnegiea gigantea]